jgi:hypothetical protein
MTLKYRGCEIASISVGLFVALALGTAHAAEEESKDTELQEVTVTGSRIVPSRTTSTTCRPAGA